MRRFYSDTICSAIDIGTTKICVLIGRMINGHQIDIIGVGKSISDGLSKGVVVDVAKTVRSIHLAVQEAERTAGIALPVTTIGISGSHIQSCNSLGVVPISRGEVRPYDVAHALAAARAIPIPEGMHILHVLPHYFIINGQDYVRDPIGMHGVRLEVQAHIIMGALSSVQNLVRCCEKAGVTVSDIILEPLASALSVLTEDERNLGVALLDIGGGTSDCAVYQRGTISYTKIIPIAGNHFTQDLAIGLCTTVKEAERIKRLLGTDAERSDATVYEIEDIYSSDGKRYINKKNIDFIIEARAKELLSLVYADLKTAGQLSSIPMGIVLTGGGSLLTGLVSNTQELFSLPVRIGNPSLSFDLPELLCNPSYATGYGLLLQSFKNQHDSGINGRQGPLTKRIFERMRGWMLDFF